MASLRVAHADIENRTSSFQRSNKTQPSKGLGSVAAKSTTGTVQRRALGDITNNRPTQQKSRDQKSSGFGSAQKCVSTTVPEIPDEIETTVYPKNFEKEQFHDPAIDDSWDDLIRDVRLDNGKAWATAAVKREFASELSAPDTFEKEDFSLDEDLDCLLNIGAPGAVLSVGEDGEDGALGFDLEAFGVRSDAEDD